MDLFLAVCQGLGLALAIGIGGALTALFTSAMASLAAGIDADGTDYEFIGAEWLLVTLLALVVLTVYTRGREAARYPVVALLAAAGAIAFAASLAEEAETAWPGLILGALATAAAALVATAILDGAIARTGSDASGSSIQGPAATLILAFAAAGIVTAALALFVPPTSLLVAAGLAFLALSRRRRAGEKYEGLRILR
jgi:hypothetical protein